MQLDYQLMIQFIFCGIKIDKLQLIHSAVTAKYIETLNTHTDSAVVEILLLTCLMTAKCLYSISTPKQK